MELSAFAHLTRRNIKVIQPGLVYVIEWNAGGDPEDFQEDKDSADDNTADARERRRQRRERIKEKKQAVSVQVENDQDDSLKHSTMYVA
jgi:OTU domain-containing protein 3